MSRAPFPVAIAGPSGVGKTVLVNELLVRDQTLIESISATSRPPRGDEQDGVHYYFHDKDGFERLIRDGELLEWARVHGCYYGTPISPLQANLAAGRVVLLNIDVQGAANLKKSRSDAVLIFVFPPSMEELESRLRKRGTDASSDIETRLRNARQEISAAGGFDYFVVNDEVARTTAVLETILRRERAK